MKIVEVNHLKKTFQDHIVFNDFHLVIEQGEMISIMGASGCGKSTLLYIIGMLEDYDEGEVMLYGKDIKEYTQKEKRMLYKNKIGFLFQNYALMENETVKENLIIPIRHESKLRQEELITKVLEQVGLSDKLSHKVHTLSGGQQQRVAIARLLLKECDLILADEPTGNLDEENSQKIYELLRRLTPDKTIIIVTHNPHLAEKCDVQIKL